MEIDGLSVPRYQTAHNVGHIFPMQFKLLSETNLTEAKVVERENVLSIQFFSCFFYFILCVSQSCKLRTIGAHGMLEISLTTLAMAEL